MTLQKFLTWALGVIICCLIAGALVGRVVDYIPYFVGGMVFATPFYGYYRKVTTKTAVLSRGLKWFGMLFVRIWKLNALNVGFYIVVFYVVYRMNRVLPHILLKTVIVSALATILVALGWSLARAVLKAVKHIEIPSFVETVKGAL